ncbi:hypothetical protein Pmani_007456 [Petrolisthes manimaculis]|uniref:Uncharacterized protein n=1 Tax=Petrolisthes manimaculis TaxID=1843537 RepID=A0AAE1UKU2_9EUCA|nr:hypothetical protein Pmani_007456 [Petrolisthes manimaculis]
MLRWRELGRQEGGELEEMPKRGIGNDKKDWESRHNDAVISHDNREAKLYVMYEEIEKDLLLLGELLCVIVPRSV